MLAPRSQSGEPRATSALVPRSDEEEQALPLHPILATTVHTIGHSTRDLATFVHMLEVHGVAILADVRTIPRSRRMPHFGQSALAASLAARGIRYVHLPRLCGLRKPRADSINTGWRNLSFRGYADYMQTPEFELGVGELLALAGEGPTAIMCAEAVPWQCHRSLIADALTARGVRVMHIMSATASAPHRMTPAARVRDARVVYPG